MTTAPPNANAAQQRTAPRKSRTNETCSNGSTSTSGRKRTVWIKKPVHRGDQLNQWIWDRTWHLAMEGATAESTVAVLHSLVGHEARPGEIERAVRRAFPLARGTAAKIGTAGQRERRPAWPLRDDALLARFWEGRPATVEDLAALSPTPAPDHPLDVLRTLHGAEDDALICLGVEPTGPFHTRTLREWQGRRDEIARWEMCVPNLMGTAWGTTAEGKTSARCRDNSCGFGGQRFLVLEFDLPPHAAVIRELGAAPPDVCAALIMHKIGLQCARMVVSSAGKSLHLWLDAGGRTQDQIARFYRVWCTYGADWRGSLPEQQFRLPQGYRRDKRAVQRVVYFNPTPEGGR
jgi:hypothetical protein